MQSTFAFTDLFSIPDSLGKATYTGLQEIKGTLSITHKTLSNQISTLLAPPTDEKTPSLSPDILLAIRQRQVQLQELDWQDAKEEIYPESLLYETYWHEYLPTYPKIWLDLVKIQNRVNQRIYHQFDENIELTPYPAYYRQNFHYQTNGYLSDESAELYDLQVDLLFNGTTDAMRRRILKPLKQGIKAFKEPFPRILDVACGTGRTLSMIQSMLPKAALFGVDLSPTYLRKANQFLSKTTATLPQLIQSNAEKLPYLDHYFEGVVSVFLFHELPPKARQNVINECFRVTKEGGVFIICDSMQMIDSPEFAPLMEHFHQIFHEPYYRHYIQDNLGKRLETAGFEQIDVKNHHVSKYWIARKPC